MKRIISMLVVLTLLLGAVGCSSNDAEQTGKKETTKSETASTETKDESQTELEPMTISIGHWESDYLTQGGENDAILQLLQDKFNVTFEGRGVSWSDYSEKYKLWAASGELPDIFATSEINKESYFTWIDQGIVKALPDDLSKYPKVAALLELPDVKPLEIDGSFYILPRKTYTSYDMWAMDKNMIIRKDWLEKLNLPMPTSFEEFKSVVKTMVEADIDGNNVDDTIGITHKALWALGALLMDTTPATISSTWVEEDGQWIPPYMSKDVIPGIKNLKTLYTEGLLDRDFAIMKTNDGIDKFSQGNCAVLATQGVTIHLENIKKSWEKYNNDIPFEDAVAIVPLFSHKDGKKYAYNSPIYWSETYFNGDMSDAKMDRILAIYEYLLSDEFGVIKSYGIENVDYKKDGEEYTNLLAEDEQLSEKYPSLRVFEVLASWGQEQSLKRDAVSYAKYGKGITDMAVDYYEYVKEEATPTPINFDIRLMSTPGKAKIKSISFFNDVAAVILKEGDVETEWAKVLENYRAVGVDEAIKEVNEALSK